jgi:hypothetical protein
MTPKMAGAAGLEPETCGFGDRGNSFPRVSLCFRKLPNRLFRLVLWPDRSVPIRWLDTSAPTGCRYELTAIYGKEYDDAYSLYHQVSH